MSDTSNKLGLMLPTQVDPFSTADVRSNFEKIDAAPGTHICTSSTRPSWTASQAGRKVYETDTGLEWVWDGAAFRRTHGSGLLHNNTGAWAVAGSGPGSSASTTYVAQLALSSVGIPAGGRPIQIIARVNAVDSNPPNYVHVAIAYGVTNNTGIIWEHRTGASPSTRYGSGDEFSVLYVDGLTAGYHTFSFQFRALAGSTATLGSLTMWAVEL